MSWVILSLRKKELRRAHSDYVAQDLQISREERQMSRRYQHEQTKARNRQSEELAELKKNYCQNKEEITAAMTALKKSAAEAKEAKKTESDGSTVVQIDLTTFIDESGKTLNDYNQMLNEIKEEYESSVNDVKSYWEDELAMIETEANDTETMYEQDKVNAETQMESISQELETVTQAISTEIQRSTIKLS